MHDLTADQNAANRCSAGQLDGSGNLSAECDHAVSARFTRRNLRLLRRADTAFAFIESHTV
jgi:hypothetical protein